MPSCDWKILENVVAAIETSLVAVAGARVTRNVMLPELASKRRRQVDVLVELPVAARSLRIALEVRDKSRPLDVAEVEQLCAKLQKLRVDRRCIVSRRGFTVAGKEAARLTGVETGTLKDIGFPTWWLPKTMELHVNGAELLHATINFADAAIAASFAAALGTAALSSVVVVRPGSEERTLGEFVQNEGVAALGTSQVASLVDRATFPLQVLLRGWPEGSCLRVNAIEFPLPDNFVAEYRIHRKREAVPLSSYEDSKGLSAFAAVSERLGKQFTIVTEEQPDGARKVSIHVAPLSVTSTVRNEREDDDA